MDSNDTILNLTPEREILPGYCLQSRLGVGGYGEVWSVVDRAGAKKALKIFHGHVDDGRSVRELRGLHRAAELNHPHVLKIERIEVVSGHVVALMELADGTLRDCFERYRNAGLVGIPREEVLHYISEAADALDYLFENALLAHLDIKPENLLLVGGHVRIGDFGLVKHLEDLNLSHVGGMTPRYTAPEVFEGRPTRHSDQYSLAIVYQEMLTGKLPFAGSSMAALASQHLSAAPQLDSLEPLERFAIGKALSKNSQHRFSDCRRFIERLMHRSSATLVTAAPDHARSPSAGRGSSVFDDEERHDGQTIQVALPKIVSLPRMDAEDCETLRRPTVFIGLGGFGGSVLTKLRQLLADRVGSAEQIPALQLLYIDTDPDAILAASRGTGDAMLGESEVAFAPLRSSQHYRDSIVCSLESLSRRWFYNVPRTLRTSGMRALGRLALLDNFPTIRDAIARSIGQAVDGPSLAKTAEHTKWPMAECDPRVFVVSSITGGTGGGMLVDVGYAVRQILAEMGLADDDVSGLMAYNHPRGTANGLAQANAYACLRELQYFGQPGCDYPGELACGMAGFRDAGPTFGSTYLFSECDNVDSCGTDALADDIALYLYMSSATACGPLLDKSRRLKRRQQRSEGISLRTAGISTLADTSSDDPGPYAEALCRQVARRWKIGFAAALQEEGIVPAELDQSQELTPGPDAEVTAACEREVRARGIDSESILTRIDREIDDVLGVDHKAFWLKMFDEPGQAGAGSANTPTDNDRTLRRLDAFIGVVDGAVSNAYAHLPQQRRLADELATAAGIHGTQLGKDIAEWIIGLVDRQDGRVHGALQAARFFEHKIQAEIDKARTQLADAQAAEEASRRAFVNHPQNSGWLRRSGAKTQRAAFVTHAVCLCQVSRYCALTKGLSSLESQVTAAADTVREHWKSLTQFAGRFRPLPASLVRRASKESGDNQNRIAACYDDHRREMVERLDCYCERHFLSHGQSLSNTLATATGLGTLADNMLTAARRVILAACRDTDNEFLARVACCDSQHQLDTMIRQSLSVATPGLLRAGGAKRLFAMAPRGSYADRLCYAIEKISQDEPTLCGEDNETVMVCYEGEDVSWEGVETMLIRQRHDCPEMAERLHTRINIDWTERHVLGALSGAYD